MPYRDDDYALREQLDQRRARLSRLEERLERRREEVAGLRSMVSRLATRLAEAGPASGLEPDVAKDRITWAVWPLLAVALPLTYFGAIWQRHILVDATVIPALLWLGTPALLAFVGAWPHRRKAPSLRVATLLALPLAVWPLVLIALTLLSRSV